MEQSEGPRLADAAARLQAASRLRYASLRKQAGAKYVMIKDQSGVFWKESTLLQKVGLFGLLLLAVSVLSTALNVLGFLGLVVAWIGLGVYFFTVSAASLAGCFCGPAVMMFSGTCAVMGTMVLTGVVGVYALKAAAGRARGYATPYVDVMQQHALQKQQQQQQQLPPTAQMRYAPQSSPVRETSAPGHPNNITSTTSSTGNTTQLLADISPGRPQTTQLHHTAADSPSCSVDAPSSKPFGTKATKGSSQAYAAAAVGSA